MKILCGLSENLCTRGSAELLAGYVCRPEGATPPTSTGSSFRVSRRVGCGFETVFQRGAFVGSAWTFLLATGELVGAGTYSDTNFGPCNAFAYIARNLEPDCPDARTYACVPASELGPDAGAYRGCRAPTEPGCATCCIESPTHDDCVSITGDLFSGHIGPCDPGCRPCAMCRLSQEQELLALPERPECDCTVRPELDACELRDGCECWCKEITGLKESCPGVR